MSVEQAKLFRGWETKATHKAKPEQPFLIPQGQIAQIGVRKTQIQVDAKLVLSVEDTRTADEIEAELVRDAQARTYTLDVNGETYCDHLVRTLQFPEDGIYEAADVAEAGARSKPGTPFAVRAGHWLAVFGGELFILYRYPDKTWRSTWLEMVDGELFDHPAGRPFKRLGDLERHLATQHS